MQETLLPYQIGISAIVVWLLQLAKNSPWFPWVTANTTKLNRAIAVVLAFLTSVGFHFTMTGNLTSGGQVIIAFPSMLAIAQILLHTAGQGAIQEAIYQTTVKPTPVLPSTPVAPEPVVQPPIAHALDAQAEAASLQPQVKQQPPAKWS